MLATSRGVELAQAAQHSIDIVEAGFWKRGQFEPRLATRQFALMASDYVQAVFFPALMERTLAEAPLSSIRAILPDLGRFHRDLENGRLDVASGYFTDLGPTLRSVGLFHDRLVCVLPKARSASKRPFRLKDYLALNHVVFFSEENGSSTMERHTDHALSLRGGERRVVLRAQSFMTMLDVVARHGLAATVPERLMFQWRDPDVIPVPLPFPVPEIVISMIWHDRQHREPENIWLRSLARDAAKALRRSNKAREY
jgi:DNA-binding transcriptional LysR family regulator